MKRWAEADVSGDASTLDGEAAPEGGAFRQSLAVAAGVVATTVDEAVAVDVALADDTLAGASEAGALEDVDVLVTIFCGLNGERSVVKTGDELCEIGRAHV